MMNMWSELTKDAPVSVVRRGYARSGFEFKFARCLNAMALRDYVRDMTASPRQPWFDCPVTDCEEGEAVPEIPVAFSVVNAERVLGDVIKEAAGGTLVSCVMVVTACPDDAGRELRHWYHEIGHVAERASRHFPDAFLSGLGHVATEADLPAFYRGIDEFPGFCVEYLTQVVNALVRGDSAPVASGFNQLFPWLSEGK